MLCLTSETTFKTYDEETTEVSRTSSCYVGQRLDNYFDKEKSTTAKIERAVW